MKAFFATTSLTGDIQHPPSSPPISTPKSNKYAKDRDAAARTRAHGSMSIHQGRSRVGRTEVKIKAMATATHTLTSVEEYLSTSYTPDREYKNGELIGRNAGTQKHGALQMIIGAYLLSTRNQFRMIKGFVETRLRMSPERYVVPDVMAVERPYQHGLEVTDVPAVVMEVKSPTDRFDEIMGKCFEYAAFGVPNIIVIDPDSGRQFVFQNDALQSVPASINLHLPKSNVDLTLPMDRIFEALDNDETD